MKTKTNNLLRKAFAGLLFLFLSAAPLSPVSAEPETENAGTYGLCDSFGYALEAVRVRSEPDLQSNILSLLAPGGIVRVMEFVTGSEGDMWARVWYDTADNGLQTDLGSNELKKTGYVSAPYLLTGMEALDRAIADGNLSIYPKSEIPMYFDASGTGTIDMLNPWDVLNVLDREGVRLQVSAYDGTAVFVELSQVSFCSSAAGKAGIRGDRSSFSEGTARFRASESDDPKRQTLTNSILSVALQHLGAPHAHGGESWESGVDCSAFVQKTFAACGIWIPRTSGDQYAACTPVSLDAIRPGDIIFYHGFYNGVPTAGIGHVAIYLGDGQVIHSRNVERGVCIDPIDSLPIIAAGRCY